MRKLVTDQTGIEVDPEFYDSKNNIETLSGVWNTPDRPALEFPTAVKPLPYPILIYLRFPLHSSRHEYESVSISPTLLNDQEHDKGKPVS